MLSTTSKRTSIRLRCDPVEKLAQCEHGGRMKPSQRVVLLACAGALWLPVQAAAQVVRGVIVEADSRRPVPDATVEMIAGSERRGATTDSLGAFVIALQRAGTYALHVRHVGYARYDTDSVRVGTAETVHVTVQLGRTVIPLAPLVVRARSDHRLAGFDARRAAGVGRFLTRTDIEARGAANTTDLLRGIPGVTIAPVPRRSRSLIVMQSSLGRCRAAVWIDGVQIEQFPESTPDDVLTPSAIEAVEIYNSFSAAPAQYVSGACGVVMFWTRQGGTDQGKPWRWKRMLAGVGAALVLVLLIR
jgi:Carboxypeptidase regulatory-like domain/TonB-dependent Receptor Plug Domain